MPTYAWLFIWGIAITAVAALYVREVRSKRARIADFDRHQHQAVREASTRAGMNGPNGGAQTWIG